jgi:HEAT repeat protein
LARLGDRRGLKHPKADVRLAAAQAFRDTPDPELRTMLEGLARELEPQVEKLRISGDLTKPRTGSDYTNRYPDVWVRTHRLLARFGEEQSLRRLLDAYVLDFTTYPEEHAPVIPMVRPTMSSIGPSLAGAIHGADASPTHLLERLQKLVPDGTQWTSPPLTALRASLDPSSEKPAEAREKPTQSDIVKLLDDSDPNKRAEGLAAAGYHQFVDLYDKVIEVAAHGSGVERNAAIYGLGFYGRDVTEAVLRQLMTSDDLEIRLSGFELATRRNPTRFARESMDVVRSVVKQSQTEQPPATEQRSHAASLPRLLSRLARGPLPAPLLDGLADPEPQIRRIVIEALALAGNPDAEQALQPLTMDRDIATRAAARKAIGQLGPVDR